MKVYITSSNAKRFINQVSLIDIDKTEEIYKIEFRWFNSYEIKDLLAFKLLYKNPEDFFKKYIKVKPISKNDNSFVGTKPAYHNIQNCEKLLSNFIKIKIPNKILVQGDKKINEFKVWDKDNSYLKSNQLDLFLNMMKKQFNLIETPEIEEFKNSGVEKKEDLNLNDLEIKIESLINAANNFYKKNSKNKIILDHFGVNSFIWKAEKEPYVNNTQYSNSEIWEILKEFDLNYKIHISELLKEYYKVKYNPELKFEGQLLEQLGFVPCWTCHKRDSDIDFLRSFIKNKNK